MHGFRSFDERDLLGFVDGTENPEGEAAVDAVLIGDEDAGLRRRQLRRRPEVRARPRRPGTRCRSSSRRRRSGATKLSDVEFADEDKAPNSHLALNVIEDADGEERQIMRFNMPFGRVGAAEFGTYFIGYAHAPT